VWITVIPDEADVSVHQTILYVLMMCFSKALPCNKKIVMGIEHKEDNPSDHSEG
jgi:hypothetical protein